MPGRLEMRKLTTATAYTFPGTSTAVPAIASATAARSVGSYYIDVCTDQIVLPGSSHSLRGFSPSKEARAGRMRDQ